MQFKKKSWLFWLYRFNYQCYKKELPAITSQKIETDICSLAKYIILTPVTLILYFAIATCVISGIAFAGWGIYRTAIAIPGWVSSLWELIIIHQSIILSSALGFLIIVTLHIVKYLWKDFMMSVKHEPTARKFFKAWVRSKKNQYCIKIEFID